MKTISIAAILLLAQSGTDALLTGRVFTASGVPVPDAVVVTQRFNKGGGYAAVETQTGENGEFTLPARGRVVFVRKEGFAPLSYVLRPQDRELRLALALSTEENTFHLPRCSEKYHAAADALHHGLVRPHGAKLYGWAHLFPVPVHAKVRHNNDVDYGVHQVFFPGSKKEYMLIHSGPLWGAYYPDLYLFKNVAQFKERALSTGDNTEEIRGTLASGHKFRWIGGLSEDASYYDVSPSAAEFFDQIIDQVCAVR